jgi:hypothetical protein
MRHLTTPAEHLFCADAPLVPIEMLLTNAGGIEKPSQWKWNVDSPDVLTTDEISRSFVEWCRC